MQFTLIHFLNFFQVIGKLYDNRKIANATHNMYAYRIKQGESGDLMYIVCEVIQIIRDI